MLSIRNQRLCAWSIVVGIVMFALGWALFAGMFPPHSPAASAEQIAAFFNASPNMIRLGMVLTMTAPAFYLPFGMVIAMQMYRIDKGNLSLAAVQFLSNAFGVIAPFLAALLWLTITFRPERDPQLILMLNDFAWLALIMAFNFNFVQFVCVGLAIFSDKRDQPIFPRWLGYFSLWVALLLVPGGLAVFFKTGAFAWNGLLAFWVPLNAFFLWIIVMVVYVFKAIKREESELA
jgi:hypothetical protein